MSLDPVSAVLDIGGKLIDRLWPDPAQRDAAKVRLVELQQTGELAKLAAETDLAKGQLSINQEEAKHALIFVSGWRPFVGWTCGSALAYAAILEPVARFVAVVALDYKGSFPVIDTNLTLQVLLGILGLGSLRTWEKQKAVARS